MPDALPDGQFRALVQAGILAPSADNDHPLRFERADRTLVVRGTDQFLAAPFHRRVLLWISAGAVVQNMLLEASRQGLEYQVTWAPEPGQPDLLARLGPGPGFPGDSELADAIPTRRTNRALRFSGPRLEPTELAVLEREARTAPGANLIWADSPGSRAEVLRLIRIAEGERFRCEPMHHELFSSVRFDLGWGVPADQGLSPGALGVERPLRPAFALLRHWPVMRALNLVGGHHFMGIRAGSLPSRLCPHLAVVVVGEGDLGAGARAAGMAFERVWLRASALGLALQPLAAAALFALDGYRDVRPSLRRRLAEGWARLAPGQRPMMVFRLGRAAPPPIGTARKPLESYLR
jgi:hypothetical protein